MTDFAYGVALFALIVLHVLGAATAFGPARSREGGGEAVTRLFAALVAAACVLAGIYLPRPQ